HVLDGAGLGAGDLDELACDQPAGVVEDHSEGGGRGPLCARGQQDRRECSGGRERAEDERQPPHWWSWAGLQIEPVAGSTSGWVHGLPPFGEASTAPPGQDASSP